MFLLLCRWQVVRAMPTRGAAWTDSVFLVKAENVYRDKERG